MNNPHFLFTKGRGHHSANYSHFLLGLAKCQHWKSGILHPLSETLFLPASTSLLLSAKANNCQIYNLLLSEEIYRICWKQTTKIMATVAYLQKIKKGKISQETDTKNTIGNKSFLGCFLQQSRYCKVGESTKNKVLLHQNEKTFLRGLKKNQNTLK